MNLAQPWALALAAVALPVIAAYFHRRRKTPLVVPSAILLRAIAGEATPRSRSMSKPRHLLSLLLVLLVIAGLVAAMVDLQREEEQPRNYIVVLDTSASMATTAVGGDETRFDTALDKLEAAVGRLGQQDRVALVTAADQAIVRVGLTEDHSRILDVAREQTPAGTSDGSPAALRIADAMCRANEHAALILITDGVGVSAPSTRCAIEHVPIGGIGPNVGISALSVREADALGLAEVYLAVVSDLEEPKQVEVELLLDDTLAEVVPLDLPAEGEVKRLLRVPLPPGKRLTAKLRDPGPDVLASDDIAWAPRRLGNRVRALLVTESRLSFTAEALQLHPRVDLTVIGPTDRTPSGAFDLVLVEAERSVTALPTASHLVMLGVPTTELGVAVSKPEVENAQIVRWSFDDTLFRFVSFDEVQVPKATIFEVSPEQTSLIDTDEGSIALSASSEDRKVIAFGFRPHESDFVLRVGFVNLIANLVEWAAPALGPSESGELEAFAQAAVESHVDPPITIAGTTRGDWSGPVRTHRSMWQLLAMIAAALLALEWLLPAAAFGVNRVWDRVRGQKRRTRRAAS